MASNGSRTYGKFKGPVCDQCGFVPESTAQLDVHHVDGDSSNNEGGNLQTLCANCHRLVHYPPDSPFESTPLIFAPARAVEARRNAALTQHAASREMGVARQTIVNLENGNSIPGAKTLGRMAELYGVAVGFFFIESDGTDVAQTTSETIPTGLAPPTI